MARFCLTHIITYECSKIQPNAQGLFSYVINCNHMRRKKADECNYIGVLVRKVDVVISTLSSLTVLFNLSCF